LELESVGDSRIFARLIDAHGAGRGRRRGKDSAVTSTAAGNAAADCTNAFVSLVAAMSFDHSLRQRKR
jgi:hypothetical protein